MFWKTSRPSDALLSKSSRFNLRFMRRTNLLAILMFVVGILVKLIVGWVG